MFKTIRQLRDKRCPECGSRILRRRRRVGLLQKEILPLFGIYPYHCGQCKCDFYLAYRSVMDLE